MKTKLLGALSFVLMLAISAPAQDTTTLGEKEIRQQERTERRDQLKEDLQNAGQSIGEAASTVGERVKEKAKVAGEAIKEGAGKVGDAVKTGFVKAEDVIEREGDKLKARRDSIRARKAQRDTL